MPEKATAKNIDRWPLLPAAAWSAEEAAKAAKVTCDRLALQPRPDGTPKTRAQIVAQSRHALEALGLAAPTFAVGDRVRVVKRKSYGYGRVGTATFVIEEPWPGVEVEFKPNDTCLYGPSALAHTGEAADA